MTSGTLVQRTEKVLGDVIEIINIPAFLVLQIKFYGISCSVAVNHAWSHNENRGFRYLLHVLVEAVHDSRGRVFVSFPL